MATKRKTTEQFINESRKIHGATYDYSEVLYKNQLTPVKILCKQHGEFWQTPKQHLRGQGCPECGKIKSRKKTSNRIKSINRKPYTKEEFIKKAEEIYGIGKFIYDKTEINGSYDLITITCPVHGDFSLPLTKFIHRKRGCKICNIENKKRKLVLGKEKFIEKSREIHGKDRYDYSLVNYKNNREKIIIICHEKDQFGNEHGEFLQTPANHLKTRGCPLCKSEKLVYEEKLYYILCEIFGPENIIRQYRNENELQKLSIDFFIPKYKIGVEHQGSQHFRPLNYFGGETKFNIITKNDILKKKLCTQNGIKLFYFSFEKSCVPATYIDKVYTDIIEFKKVLENEKSNWN